MNMQRNGRKKSRHQPTKKEKRIMLEQIVTEVQENLTNGTHTNGAEAPALVNPDGIIESLRMENNLLHRDNDTLKLELAAADAQTILHKQRIAALEAALVSLETAPVECEIRHDVKATDLAKWRNDGWTITHYQFVDNDRSVASLAVVMERPVVAATDLLKQEEAQIQPEAPAPSNFDTTQKVEVTFEDILIADKPEPTNEPELVPSMDTTGITIESVPQPQTSLLDTLKEKAPILAAIDEYGVDAVKAAMDEEVINAGLQGYNNAMQMLNLPIETKRFESRLLPAGKVNPDTITSEDLIIEVMLP